MIFGMVNVRPAHGPTLANLSPRDQLRAGQLPRRIPQLFLGLTFFGMAMGMFVQANVGLDPWDVFHQGVAGHLGLSIGTVAILTSLAVLTLWVPLRQWPGLGTVANAVWLGLALDVTIRVVPAPDALWTRCALFAVALVINGIGGAMYIGSQLGPGPRDGLMTGIHQRTGMSVRLARTCVEVTALGVGWLLGGNVGVGTVIFAVAIGPLVQFFLRYFIVDLHRPNAQPTDVDPAAEGD